MVINSDIAYMIARQRASELAAQAAREARTTSRSRREWQARTSPIGFRTRVLALWAAVASQSKPVAAQSEPVGAQSKPVAAQSRPVRTRSRSVAAPNAGTTPMGCIA